MVHPIDPIDSFLERADAIRTIVVKLDRMAGIPDTAAVPYPYRFSPFGQDGGITLGELRLAIGWTPPAPPWKPEVGKLARYGVTNGTVEVLAIRHDRAWVRSVSEDAPFTTFLSSLKAPE